MGKRELLPFENNQVRLRLLEEGDLPLTLAWRNQDHVRVWFFYSAALTVQQHSDWFRKYLSLDNDFVFIIEDRSSGCKPVGQVALYNIDWEKRCAEFGRFMIGDSEGAGKGLAKSATQLVLTGVARSLDLQDIYLEVYKRNERAVAIYQKCGFQTESEDGEVVRMVFHVPGTG